MTHGGHAWTQKSFFWAFVITRDLLLVGFPNDPNIRLVSDYLQYMWKAKTNSGARVGFTLSTIPRLSGSQGAIVITYAMRLYNARPPNMSLSADDVQNPERLKRLEIRLLVVHAVHKGALTLMGAFKNQGSRFRTFKWPAVELIDRRTRISICCRLSIGAFWCRTINGTIHMTL